MSTEDPSTTLDSSPVADEAARQRMMKASGRNLNYIGEDRLLAVIGASVRHAMERQLEEVVEEQLTAVAKMTQRGFVHLLKSTGKAVRGLPVNDFVREVEQAKNKILAEREKARLELSRLTQQMEKRQKELNEERKSFLASKQKAGAALDSRLAAEIAALFEEVGTDNPALLQERVRQLALRGVQAERKTSVEGKLADHDREVADYQRRIKKLTESLSRTEEEIKRLAAMKDVEFGVASIYRTVQGLSADDESAETKKEMMTAIFEANLSLQEKLAG
jgi:predicted RNA-binding protein with RPS1 domain